MVGLIIQFAIGMAIIAFTLQILSAIVTGYAQWVDTLPRPAGLIVAISTAGFVLWVIATIIKNVSTPT